MRQYEGIGTQDAILRAECSGWSQARVKVFIPVQTWFPVAILVTKHASTLDLWAVFFAKDNCRVLSAKFLR